MGAGDQTGSSGSAGCLRAGDRYELLDTIATGGMGTVFLARLQRSRGFTRLVAIKSMRPELTKDAQFVAMFLDEARLAARLHHPNIVSTLDVIDGDGQLLIVMDYVDGASVSRILETLRDTGDRVPVAIACALVHDLLLGLHEAHVATDEHGEALSIVHRDVSPQNVIVGLDGLARVLDFGIACAHRRTVTTGDQVLKGKLPYMPPEQLFGEAVDHRVDVYSAGVVLWELLCGRALFSGRDESIIAKISEGIVPPPSTRADDVSAALDAVVLHALARDRDGRFPSARAMADALAAAVPLPHRTEIAAWVGRWVLPRAIPTEARIGLAADGIGLHAEVAATLARVTAHGAEVDIAPTEVFSMTATIESPDMRAPSLRDAARRWAPITIALGALAVAAFAFAGSVARAHEAPQARETAASLPVGVPVPPPVPVPSASASPDVAPPAPLPRAAVASAPVRLPPRPPRPRAPAAVRTPPAGCDPPTYLDAHGKKHFKLECL